MSKRSIAASTLQQLGALRALEALRSKPGILVITHHRIGNPDRTRFDRAIFSASADAFDQQVRYFKRHLHIVDAEELEALVFGREKLNRMHVALTFDDGYLEDYTTAFDILKSHNCSASFFLVPEYVGTSSIPWWDEIAFLVRNTTRSSIQLTYPAPLTADLNGDRESAIYAVLQHFKQPGNLDHERFILELREQADCDLPVVERRFLNWDEAREMKAAGMTIGSHTQSHRLLSQLAFEEQRWELAQSRQIIEQNIGAPVTSIAYPAGIHGTFDATSEELARELGYTMGFSFYGGFNLPGQINPTNILRMAPNPDPALFRAETLFMAKLGRMLDMPRPKKLHHPAAAL